MNITKAVFAFFIISAALYGLLASKTLMLGENLKFCEHSLVRAVAPWSSSCFYHSLEDEDAPAEQINFEHQMLQRFVKNDGVATEVLWYRSRFYRKHQVTFRKTFQELHAMHIAYTKSEHTKLISLMEYLQFLKTNTLSQLAQQTLDDFCTVYVPVHRNDVVEELERGVNYHGFNLNLRHCKSITQK